MDKPSIISNLPSQLTLKRIQELAELEYNRQLDEFANKVLYGKSLDTLLSIISYKENSDAVKEGDKQEGNIGEYQDGDQGGEAAKAGRSNCNVKGRKNKTGKSI